MVGTNVRCWHCSAPGSPSSPGSPGIPGSPLRPSVPGVPGSPTSPFGPSLPYAVIQENYDSAAENRILLTVTWYL